MADATAMSDATKRKEPEPETPAPSADNKAAEPESGAQKESPDDKKEAEPAAKRLKATPPEPAAVRKQVEYYLSDENLRYDKFFHEKISSDSEGWLEMSLVLSCNKMKLMKATKEDVVGALKESKIEVKDDGASIRRPSNAPLPKLEARPMHSKKNSANSHNGGILMVFKNVPAEQSWVQVKEKLKSALPEKAQLWFVSEVTDKSMCFVAASPFENDVQFFDDLTLDVGGTKLKSEVCYGEILQQALRLLPKYIRERREKESRKRQKEKNRPIVVGNQRFINVGALRGRVKEIINSRSDGEHLKTDGSDFKLIKALLEHHPKGAEKSKGMVGIKVDQSTQGENRCFFMVREDNSSEDFSAKKCLDAIEINPPYAPKPSSEADPAKTNKDDAEKAEPAKGNKDDAGAAKAEPAKANKDDAEVAPPAKATEPTATSTTAGSAGGATPDAATPAANDAAPAETVSAVATKESS
eukprot:CAMPEP_0117501004 /NCGR_PEP_ID=MMETSP0784-20121206/23071_1 /TAXON_ID=39447 /ORGANISM="" /LENGTH=469 /DNA_ID=CAMNT_0005296237 /DNA_START=70 /DNA_END=1479 /DNA_ORIENTATION=-